MARGCQALALLRKDKLLLRELGTLQLSSGQIQTKAGKMR
jgi:hypothetical protein